MSTANQPTQKRKLNVYTMMLILSFIALLTGTILLYMELNTYSNQFLNWWDTTGAFPAPATILGPLFRGM